MTKRRENYDDKLRRLVAAPLFVRLTGEEQAFIRRIAVAHRLTAGEFHQVVEICRDLSMWGERFISGWESAERVCDIQGRERKKYLLAAMAAWREHLRRTPIDFSGAVPGSWERTPPTVTETGKDRTLFGMCPVASERTICCNLRTIDAVINCPFGCTYCTIQTFYEGTVEFTGNLREKLDAIELEPGKFYHVGTGQSSDSLVFGNRNGLLDDLMDFAANHPDILLELKTKSDAIDYFLTRKNLPENIVCSWSLNPPPVIAHEEYFTAPLDRRIAAARRLAARGIPVAFHFHPMVRYRGWETGYSAIAGAIMRGFDPEDVLFITFGSLTLIKPVIRKIREQGMPTRVLQMEMTPDPHGKITVPDAVKIAMFGHLYSAFTPWHDDVFFYLCMEKASIWEGSLGRTYPDSAALEMAFRDAIHRKWRSRGR